MMIQNEKEVIMAKRAKNLAVSQKIKLLESEGYPTNQSIAIALDMERRGTLTIPIFSKPPKINRLSRLKTQMMKRKRKK